MPELPKTDDPRLNTLIKLVEKHYGRKVANSPFNHFARKPFATYIGITQISLSNTLAWGSNGGITDDTLLNPRIMDEFAFVEMQVGTKSGSGIAYASDFVPLKNSLKSLDGIVDRLLNMTFSSATGNYCDWIGLSFEEDQIFIPKMATVEPMRYFEGERERKIPVDKLKDIVKTASQALCDYGDDGRARIQVHDEVRRFVNSEGTVIRDRFFGYHLRFLIYAFDNEGRNMPFIQNFYFMENRQMDKARIVKLAENMAYEAHIRKDCEVLESGIYPGCLEPPAMASELHEAVTHMIASDQILDGSTLFGWENFGNMASNKHISIFTDPNMKGRWGSFEYDHQGVKAERRPLIKDGVIVGYLADRQGAHYLSKLTGEIILPGDSRFYIENNNESFPSQPRISNLDIFYKGPRKPKSKREMLRRFVNYLKKHKLTGVYVASGSGAECNPQTGEMSVDMTFPYIVTAKGEFHPTKFIRSHNYAQNFLRNIMVMGEPRSYVPHRCGDNGADVRAGIMCGAGIVKNMPIVAYRPERRKQRIV